MTKVFKYRTDNYPRIVEIPAAVLEGARIERVYSSKGERHFLRVWNEKLNFFEEIWGDEESAKAEKELKGRSKM